MRNISWWMNSDYPIWKQLHSALVHCKPLELLDVLSLRAVVEQSVAVQYSDLQPAGLRTAPDTSTTTTRVGHLMVCGW
jgi:hypothetical protein